MKPALDTYQASKRSVAQVNAHMRHQTVSTAVWFVAGCPRACEWSCYVLGVFHDMKIQLVVTGERPVTAESFGCPVAWTCCNVVNVTFAHVECALYAPLSRSFITKGLADWL
jgi:NADP-dependent 3-hydroxy acid dehydrogenase YdfG